MLSDTFVDENGKGGGESSEGGGSSPLLETAAAAKKGKRGDSRMEWPAMFSILCTMAGTGILQLPLTAHQGGWVCVGLIVIVAFMANSTVIVQIFHKATLLGVTTIFLILCGKFLLEGIGGDGKEGLFDFGHEDDNGRSRWQVYFTCMSAGLVLIPVLSLKHLGETAPLAAFGLAASMMVVFEVVAYAFVLGRVDRQVALDYDLPLPDNYNQTHPGDGRVQYHTFEISGFVSAFAAITLSFGGHAVFPSIEREMKHPERFAATFDFAFVCLVVLYLATCISGYATFGDIVYSPVLCNFSRDRSSAMGIITAITKLVIALHVMSAYPLLLITAATDIEHALGIEATDEDVRKAPVVTGDSEALDFRPS
eukprot:g3315.t1